MSFAFNGEKFVYELGDGYSLLFKRDEFGTLHKKRKVFTFLSLGLTKLGQKELLLIIEYNDASIEMLDSKTGMLNIGNTFTRQVIQYFQLVFQQAKNSNFVTETGYTQLGGSKFLGNFPGILYSSNQSLPSEYKTFGLSNEHYLLCSLITEEELQVYFHFGPTRVLSNLGFAYRWYPVPCWNDLSRQTVTTLESSKLSDFFKGLSHVVFQGIRTRLDFMKYVKLRIPNKHKEKIKEFVNDVHFKSDAAMVFRGYIDPQADSHLYYDGKTVPDGGSCSAISHSQTKDFLGGSFISFGIGEEKNTFQLVEDGYIILLVKETYGEFMVCLRDGKPFKIGLGDKDDKKTFELVWYGKEEQKEENTDENTVVAPTKKKLGKLSEVQLLSPDADFQQRKISPHIFGEFVGKFVKKCDVFLEQILEEFKSKKEEEGSSSFSDVFDFGLVFKIPKDKTETEFVGQIPKKEYEVILGEFLSQLTKEFSVFECSENGPEIKVRFTFHVEF